MRLAFLPEFSDLSRCHIEPIQSPTMRITYEQRIADARLSVVLTGSVTPILIGLTTGLSDSRRCSAGISTALSEESRKD